MLIKNVNTKNKKLAEKWKSTSDFDGFAPSKIVQFHDATGEALKQSISTMEMEKSELKQRIKELEATLIPRPLFAEPFYKFQPTLTLENILESSSNWKGSSSLLL